MRKHDSCCHSTVDVSGNVVVDCGRNELSNFRSFIILRSGEGLTSNNIDNSANFSNEAKIQMNEAFWACVYFL